jgi:coproporphyrinogen III oxidase-like Fe-S oxidoreductase
MQSHTSFNYLNGRHYDYLGAHTNATTKVSKQRHQNPNKFLSWQEFNLVVLQ